jgi:diguanylate cyclase (GGDEF)-like protein
MAPGGVAEGGDATVSSRVGRRTDDVAAGRRRFDDAVAALDDPVVFLADVGNIRLGDALDSVMEVLAQRVTHLLRPGTLVARVGADQLAVAMCGVDDEAAGALAERLRRVFDDPVNVAGERRRLHGTVVWARGEDPVWAAFAANAAAVEAAHRDIFLHGVFGGRGLAEVATFAELEPVVAGFGQMMEMDAVELVADGRRVGWPQAPSPPRPPEQYVPIVIDGEQVGHGACWYAPGKVVPDHPQYFSSLAAVLSDTIRRLRDAERLGDDARRDPLTGLVNRAGLAAALAGIDGRFALAIVDVDDFRMINARVGHAGGDTVLCAIARLLDNDGRAVDVCARWGGEEFVVVLPGVDAGGAHTRLARLLARSAADIDAGGVPVTFSCGVATAAASSGFDDAFAAADAALYAAKRAGKARVLVAPASGQ